MITFSWNFLGDQENNNALLLLFLLWRDFILLQVSILFFLRIQYITHNSAATWWRHQMETFSALLALCAGNSPVPVNSPHKGQWHGALMFSLICAWISGWVNNREAGDLRRQRAHYGVIVMTWEWIQLLFYTEYFICTGNINRTLGNKIVDHSDVVGASPVGAAPTTSPFST